MTGSRRGPSSTSSGSPWRRPPSGSRGTRTLQEEAQESAGPERPILLVSDVHLSPLHPGRTELFHAFLDRVARSAEHVYILGDLFDVYVGPRHALRDDYRATIDRLIELRASGVGLTFLHGNRDFQVGSELPFDAIHPDPIVLERAGQRVLLAHGDELCTRDRSYGRARWILRSRIVRWLAGILPVGLVLGVARGIRGYSRHVVKRKDARVTDLAWPAVEAAYRHHDADVLVVGHTHRVRDLVGEIDGRPRRLVGLGDWTESGNYAVLDGADLSTRGFALAADASPDVG